MESIRNNVKHKAGGISVYLFMGMMLLSQLIMAQSQVQTVQLSTHSSAMTYSQFPENNFSGESITTYIAQTGFASEVPFTKRTYFKIDLSSIPSNATIHSATLHLSGFAHNPASEDFQALITYPQQDWSDSELNWDNQPETPLENFAQIADATSENEDASVDITDRIRDLMYFPGEHSNYGFCIRLQEEEPTNMMSYYSEHAEDQNLQPYLEIEYEMPIDMIYDLSSEPMEQDEPNSGAVSIAISQGNAPYSYTWSDGTNTIGATAQIDELSSGIYYLTVTDNLNRSFTFEKAVGYDPEWRADIISQYSAFPQVVEKTSGYGWSQAVRSEAELKAGEDGWIEYKVEKLKHRMFGFAEPQSYQNGYTAIRAGIYLREDRNLRKVVNGSETSIGSYNIGDVVRIEKKGEFIEFFLNGNLLNQFEYTGSDQKDHVLSFTAFRPNSRLSNVVTSFKRALDVRVYVENEGMRNNTTGKSDGDIFALPIYGTPPYSYAWSNGVTNADRIQGLVAGTYTVTVTDANGAVASKVVNVFIDPDAAMSWQSSKYYDENENLLGASKSYADVNGKLLQSQTISTRSLNVFASQAVYDNFNRAAVSSLSAPTFHDRLDYQSNFMKASTGVVYDAQHFDEKDDVTNNLGQVHNPYGVENTTKGSLGWYYSNNNTVEPYQDKTDYPFTRASYAKFRPGQVVETSAPHDAYKMGSGHEGKSYRIPAGGELVYMFGYGGGWKIGKNYRIEDNYDPTDPTSIDGGLGTIITDQLSYDHKVFKQISYSPEGLESVTFIDSDGKIIATALSGTNDQNVNEFEMNVRSLISGPVDGDYRFVDIHIAEGCETSLDLHDQTFTRGSGYSFDIVNLITGELVHENLSTNFPTLEPGVYRIVDKMFYGPTYENRNNLFDIQIKYKVNYHHFSLNYYDKKNQLIGVVSPEGFDYNFTPGVTSSGKFGYEEFNVYNNHNDWEFLSNNLQKIESDPITPSTGNEIQFTNVTLFLAPSYQSVSMVSQGSGGFNQFNHAPTIPTSPEGGEAPAEEPENQVSSALHNFSADSTTFFASSVNLIGTGGGGGGTGNPGGPLIPSCTIGQYFSSVYTAGIHCWRNGDKIIDLAIPTGEGLCVTCKPRPANGGCNPPANYHLGKIKMDFEVNAIAPAGTTQVTTFTVTAEKIRQTSVNGPTWYFHYEAGGYLQRNGSVYDAAVAVINPTLSKTTTKVEVNITNLEYRRFERDAPNNCIWHERIYPSTGANAISLLGSQLADLKLYYDFTTEKLGDFPQHQITEQFEYNTIGELIRASSLDEGKTEYVYTKDGLLRFSQSAQQRVDKKFSYTNYDNKGRPIEMGIVNETTQALEFQNHFSDRILELGSSAQTTINNVTLEQINNLVDNTGTSISNVHTEDETHIRYDVSDAGLSTLGAPYGTYVQRNLRGRIAHVWNEHTATWYSYQSNGRLEWMVTNYYNFAPKSIHYNYDQLGNVTHIIYQKDNPSDYFEHKYTYDRVGNVKRVYTRTADNGRYNEEAEYIYALDGSLKRVVIGKDLQGVDYTYNTLGLLKAINSPNLGETNHLRYFVDPGRDGNSTQTDIFGMSIDYFAGDYSRGNTNVSSGTAQKDKYNGQIAAIRWNTALNQAATDEQLAYDFDYLKTGWLKSARYTNVGPFGSTTQNPTTAAGGFGPYSVSGLSYDKNGNIQSLIRNGSTQTGIDMDNFTYHYDPAHPNRLAHLSDAVNSNYTTDIDDQGSWDISDNTTWNNVYDAEGQLIENKQEGLRYFYNAYGLVERIEKDHTPLNGVDNYVNHVSFEYNDAGLRSKKTSYDNGGTAIKHTWYVRDAGGAEVAQYQQTIGQIVDAPEYPLIADARLGTYNRSTNTRLYELMDHLGNVRATFSRDPGTNNLLINSYADYYPFGSSLPGRNLVSSPSYKHGYQGQFTMKDEETGLDAFELRMWDSRLARWTSTDPYAQFHSPYVGMGNDPINQVDHNGGISQLAAAGIGAGIGAGAGYLATGKIEGAIGGGLIGASIGYGFGDRKKVGGWDNKDLGGSVIQRGFDPGFSFANTFSSGLAFGDGWRGGLSNFGVGEGCCGGDGDDPVKPKTGETKKLETQDADLEEDVTTFTGGVVIALVEPSPVGELVIALYGSYLIIKHGPEVVQAMQRSLNDAIHNYEEHDSNKSPSNRPKHEKGNTRRGRDQGGEKADPGRRWPRNPPGGWKNWKGPWPPKSGK